MSWGSIWQTNLKMVGKDNVLRFNPNGELVHVEFFFDWSDVLLTVSEVVDNCKIYWESSTDAKQSAIDYINAVIEVGTGMNVPPAKALLEEFFN